MAKKRKKRIPTAHSEENYLKGIFKLSSETDEFVSTNAIAEIMNTTPASVTDMLKKLSEKGHIDYEKYRGVRLSKKGEILAKNLIRNHRLWETFLVEKLGFPWSKVHDFAEDLEHIHSPELVNRLHDYLGRPKFDPHGDPIPDEQGKIPFRSQTRLADLKTNQEGEIVGVADHSEKFLNFLESLDMILGTKVKVLQHFDYDNSLKILIAGKNETIISSQVSRNLYLQLNNKK